MISDLRQLIADEADTAALKNGLRTYKAQEMLRIGGRDLCGLAELEEVTARTLGAGSGNPAKGV